jgi:hypothetical protein
VQAAVCPMTRYLAQISSRRKSANEASQFSAQLSSYTLQHIVAHLNHCRGRTLTWQCTATPWRKPE